MRIDIITLFPEVFTPIQSSIIKRAQEKGLVAVYLHNLRDFTHDTHRTVDDAPYGGGAGMVMKIEPIFEALENLRKQDESPPRVILLSPQGRVFNQSIACELSEYERIILICGHYEGIDERVTNFCCDDEISIGDYVLTGGELPAMVIIDVVTRLIPGVIDEESRRCESFDDDLLDYPQFTRPRDYRGWTVPEVLLSGNHQEIRKWRDAQRIIKTREKRPDLLQNSPKWS